MSASDEVADAEAARDAEDAGDADNAGHAEADPDVEATDDAEPATELDASDVERLAQRERRARKTLRFEVDDGYAEYTYRMVREGRLAELSEKHFETPEVRDRRQATDLDLDADSYEKFRADVIKAGVVEAPTGHKNTNQYVRERVPDEWQAELFDAITDFSTMDEEEYVRFR